MLKKKVPVMLILIKSCFYKHDYFLDWVSLYKKNFTAQRDESSCWCAISKFFSYYKRVLHWIHKHLIKYKHLWFIMTECQSNMNNHNNDNKQWNYANLKEWIISVKQNSSTLNKKTYNVRSLKITQCKFTQM